MDPNPASLRPFSAADRLKHIAAQLKLGQPAETLTAREFLHWFDAQRRGFQVVRQIRRSLSKAKLKTEPDFEATYIDGPISFISTEESAAVPVAESARGTQETMPSIQAGADPTYKIGRLISANTRPVSVSPNQHITEAITIMLANDFSQLPVMTTERDVKGVISWMSIGSGLTLGRKSTESEVRECMDEALIISSDASLFDAIEIIVKGQYVLIRDSHRIITGIVTTSDLSLEFRQLAEPFLLLGEIENHIRQIMIERGRFTKEQLQHVRDPNEADRNVEVVSDLTFGDYIRLLENLDGWSQLQLPVDRTVFTRQLDEVREIRNDVMHFDPDPITNRELDGLRKFAAFLRRLQMIVPKGP